MATVQIRIGTGALDLLPKEEDAFYITKLAHDLRDLQTRNATFTKAISVPRTRNNTDLLGIELVQLGRDADVPYSFLDCQVYISDNPVLTEGRLMVINQQIVGHTIELQIFGGVVDLFEAIPDTNLSELDWSDESFEWDLTSLQPFFAANEGLLLAKNTWYLNTNHTKALRDGLGTIPIQDTDLSFSGIWYHFITLFKKILEPLPGFTFDFSEMEEQTLVNELLLSIPTTRLFENFASTDSFQGVREANNEITANLGPGQATDLNFPIEAIDEPAGFWNVAEFYFDITAAGFYDIKFHMEMRGISQATGTVGDIAIFVGGAGDDGVQIFVRSVSTSLVIVNFGRSVFLNPGERVRMRYQTRGNITPGAALNYFNSSFEVAGSGNITTRYVDISEFVPEITQTDFVRAVLQLFHLIPDFKDGVVTFKLWENIQKQPWVDISEFIVEDREQTIQGFVPGYGQNNKFEYTNDEDVERDGTDFSFPQLNEILPAEEIKIKSLFSASDGSTSDPEFLSAPLFPFEYFRINATSLTTFAGAFNFTTNGPHNLSIGDLLFARNIGDDGYQGRRIVVALDGDSGGAVDTVWPQSTTFPYEYFHYEIGDIGPRIAIRTEPQEQTIRDGGLAVSDQQRGATFGDELRWDQLAEVFYENFIPVMRKPVMETAWFRFPTAVFTALDPLAPVYVKGRLFYLNILEQYTVTKFCRVELIEFKEPRPLAARVYYNFAPNPIDFEILIENEERTLSGLVTNTGDVSIDFQILPIVGINAGLFVFDNPVTVGVGYQFLAINEDFVLIPETEKVFIVPPTTDWGFGYTIEVPVAANPGGSFEIGYSTLGDIPSSMWMQISGSGELVVNLGLSPSVVLPNFINDFPGTHKVEARFIGVNLHILVDDISRVNGIASRPAAPVAGQRWFINQRGDVNGQNVQPGRYRDGRFFSWFIDVDIWELKEGSGFNAFSGLGTTAFGVTSELNQIAYWNASVWQTVIEQLEFFTLAPNLSREIDVVCTMDDTEGGVSASFTVVSIDPDTFDVVVGLAAQSIDVFSFTVIPNPFDMGGTGINQNKNVNGQITNTGTAPIELVLSDITGPDASFFEYRGSTPEPPTTFILNPGQNQNIRIRFNEDGVTTGTLTAEFTVIVVSPIDPGIPDQVVPITIFVTP